MHTDRHPELKADTKPMSAYAVASMVAACLSLVIGPLGFIPAIVLGHVARKECLVPGGPRGGALALGALWVSYAMMVVWLVAALMVALAA
jgi:hypothetical protein